jgi:hypothetical protein
MLLQTDSGGWQFGLLVLVLAGVGLVSYWVSRDAAARGMDGAPYWGVAVGVASVIGVYLSARPETDEGGEHPFDALWGDGPPPTVDGDASATDPAHADLPPVPELTAERVADASETTLRGYARRYDRLDATGDPEWIRAALLGLVEADETDRLGETLSEADAEVGPGRDTPEPGTGADHRRHLGRPRLHGGDVGETADTGADTPVTADGPLSVTEEEATDRGGRGFEWVEETYRSSSGASEDSTSRSFAARESCLISYSRDIAADLRSKDSTWTSSTGVRPRVYFAPSPASCSATRRATSVV